ncbi:hypothetical protein ACFL5O_11535 [Myxococcota bacterium]
MANPDELFSDFTLGRRLFLACGVRQSQKDVVCWGSSEKGASGTLKKEPVRQLAPGSNQICALLETGAVWCTEGEGWIEEAVSPGEPLVEIAVCEGMGFCGVSQDNAVRCWGTEELAGVPAELRATNGAWSGT